MKQAVVLILLAATLLAQPASAEQVLHRGNSVEPETLDPHRARGVSASNILRDLHEGLTTEAPDGAIEPGTAASWTVSDDGLRWQFALREGARWSDGAPVTAPEFAAGLRRSLTPATGSAVAQILAPIQHAPAVLAGRLPPEALGVEAPDERTLVIRLGTPAPNLPAILAHPAAYPWRADADGAHVGNGAYRLEQWLAQSHVTLVRNRHYWNDAATRIDRVVFYPTENAASELKRYRAGELDLTDTIPVGQARWIRENLGAEYEVAPYLGVYYYGFNLTRPPFQDQPGLRRALALAVDREALTQKILATGEIAAYSWVPPGLADYTPQAPAWASWPREQQMAEARRLYAEAGYSKGKPLELELRYNTGANHKRVALAVSWMWREALGVRTQLVNEEYKVYLQNRRHRAVTQVFRADWIGDYADAASFAERMISVSGLDDTGYASPRYDDRVARARATADPAQRRAMLEEAERILLDELPVLPLYFYVSKHLVKPGVAGWQPNLMDHHYTRHLAKGAP
ncbi:MAG TPA: peptide ABC transporter substrate-binding protein [Verrucomicrobiae bacterium]|nr:peptide ABC transporter substrate-binding protein [Verrucomicrobiae bacterium]